MNETARKLMKRIDDASFAMDDVILSTDDNHFVAGFRCTFQSVTLG